MSTRRSSARLAGGGGKASTPIQVKKTSLLSARRERYTPPVTEGAGKKAKFDTHPRHMCCRNHYGQAVNIDIVGDDGNVVGQLQCIGDAVAECSMFAGDWWTFDCVGGGEETVKLCWCCACHFNRGNPRLEDNRPGRISSTTLLSGLKTTWEVHKPLTTLSGPVSN